MNTSLFVAFSTSLLSLDLTKQQQRIFDILSKGKQKTEKWYDWKWQINHRISDLNTAEKLLDIKFPAEKRSELELTINKFPLSVTPYYLSLIDTKDYFHDPVYLQALPSIHELNLKKEDMADPLSEDHDAPVPGITHRYPDRVLFLVSSLCSMYCRHCTRKRKVGDVDLVPSKKQMEMGIKYISEHPEIRDVLLSGGDPFLLEDSYLDWILEKVRAIPHVQVVRIGTRTPVVLPQRITDDLCTILKKHHPLWLNTHFNHPNEITQESKNALAKLANVGIPLGNQSVLLAGVNDCPRVMTDLVHKLVMNRVRPYYLYQCDLSEGLSHFRTPIGKGIEILEGLIGHTSGFCVPNYVIDAPGGGGKIRVLPNYLISYSGNKVILRNFEGVVTSYQQPTCQRDYNKCNLKCTKCPLGLKMDYDANTLRPGIAGIMEGTIPNNSLVPDGTSRINRRENH